MEPVITLFTCAFMTFCATDGTCTDTSPIVVTVNLGESDDDITLSTTPGANGGWIPAEVLDPQPAQRYDPVHLLARSRTDGALLISMRADAASDSAIRATLRRHPDQRGNPTGAGAFTSSEVACTQSFVRP